MTSNERIWSLLKAVDYIHEQPVPGALVECGVWRGGSVMAMAFRLQQQGYTNRDLWLYDTFSGMTEPSEVDIDQTTGVLASRLLETTPQSQDDGIWCIADRTDVRRNLEATGYPLSRVHLVEGDVVDTLNHSVPEEIAILRLDTDWYESTKACLQHLYPRLLLGGVCILDDYGHWQGARRAVDEYFDAQAFRPFMHPIDFSGRVFIKTR